MWCMENGGLSDDEDFESADDGSDVEMHDAKENVKSREPIKFVGLQLGTTKESMTSELFANLTQKEGYESSIVPVIFIIMVNVLF